MLFCLTQFVGITLPAFAGFRMPFQTVLGAPLGLAILTLAGWAMVRGLGEDGGSPSGSAADYLGRTV